MKKAYLVCVFVLLSLLVSCPTEKTFKITYKINNSTETAKTDVTKTYVVGSDVAFPGEADLWESERINSTKILVGWALDSAATTPAYPVNDKITLSEDTVLYGVWEDGKRLTLNINYNGATEHEASVFYYRTSPDDKRGWYKDAECKTVLTRVRSPKYDKILTFNVDDNTGEVVKFPITYPRSWQARHDTYPDNTYAELFEQDTEHSGYDKLKASASINTSRTIKVLWNKTSADGSDNDTLPCAGLFKKDIFMAGWCENDGSLYYDFIGDERTQISLKASRWIPVSEFTQPENLDTTLEEKLKDETTLKKFAKFQAILNALEASDYSQWLKFDRITGTEDVKRGENVYHAKGEADIFNIQDKDGNPVKVSKDTDVQIILTEEEGTDAVKILGGKGFDYYKIKGNVDDENIDLVVFKLRSTEDGDMYDYSKAFIKLNGTSYEYTEAIDVAVEKARTLYYPIKKSNV